jgi:hypothetical protein
MKIALPFMLALAGAMLGAAYHDESSVLDLTPAKRVRLFAPSGIR